MNTTLLIIFTLLATAVRYADYWTSVRGPKYGTYETNKLFRDDKGNFTANRFLILNGAAIAIGIGLNFIDAYMWSLVLVPLILTAFAPYQNYKAQKANRLQQIAFLKDLASLTDPIDRAVAFNHLKLIITGGRIRYVLFGWISTDDNEGAVDRLQSSIYQFSLDPKF